MNKLKTGILLINLGTPDSYATRDVRVYLKEFLNDPRVIDIHPIARLLLVNLIIIPFRAPKSAKLYKEIWTSDGSPLLFHTQNLKNKLQEKVTENYVVDMGMRYGNPSIIQAMDRLKKQNLKKLIVIPLYPQYASSSNGSSMEVVYSHIKSWLTMPDVEVVNSFYNHPAFIACWKKIGSRYNHENYDHVLFSYHGLPERHLKKGDECNHCLKTVDCCAVLSEKNHQCYRASCFETTRLIANALNIPNEKHSVSFQSRLGRDPWIKPYSDFVIEEKAKEGFKKLLIFSPAFVADCLETIHEIGVEYDELFKEHGGEKVQLVESLNSEDFWVEALTEILNIKKS